MTGPTPATGPDASPRGRAVPDPVAVSEGAPTAVTGHHLRALGGLRGVAVVGVVAYHLGFGWASGGYLGVDLFFVLSGFLITSLLLEERVRTGALNLVEFWGRRAKRLLPALFLVVAAIGLYLILNGRFGGAGANGLVELSNLRGDAIATLLYVGNWHAIYADQSYFTQFSAPSPLQHTWSLAIEEQFYLVWPPVLVVLLALSGRAWRKVGVGVALAGALCSAGLMALLYAPGADPTRIYYGTDTRLFDLMAGAALAFLVASRPQPGPRARRTLHFVGPAAAAGLALFWAEGGTAGGLPKGFMFEGGFLLCAFLAALVVADARLFEPGLFGRALSLGPLHFLGTISYGVYLWHWPVILYLSAPRTGLSSGPLDLLRIAVTLLLATASYYWVERPIRRASFAGALGPWLAPLAGVATAVVLVVATVPAVADPAPVATVARPQHGPIEVAGVGGWSAQRPIDIAAGAISPSQPLRVAIIGDSVMGDASYGMTAALHSTGEVSVHTNTLDGFGLTTVAQWPTVLAQMIRTEHPQLIIGTWSWDFAGPSTPNALDQPKQYTALLERALRVMLAPGDGVDGVILTEFPQVDVSHPLHVSHRRQVEGTVAWNAIAASMPAAFPGHVMYLPVADSILLDGHYTSWLPPLGDPGAPRDQWVRVRKLDRGHLCPEGSARYASAVLSDLTSIFHLAPAGRSWLTGAWVTNPDFNTPPGACPDDHPPA